MSVGNIINDITVYIDIKKVALNQAKRSLPDVSVMRLMRGQSVPSHTPAALGAQYIATELKTCLYASCFF